MEERTCKLCEGTRKVLALVILGGVKSFRGHMDCPGCEKGEHSFLLHGTGADLTGAVYVAWHQTEESK